MGVICIAQERQPDHCDKLIVNEGARYHFRFEGRGLLICFFWIRFCLFRFDLLKQCDNSGNSNGERSFRVDIIITITKAYMAILSSVTKLASARA